jgi:excisionase family DNA binding protein
LACSGVGRLFPPLTVTLIPHDKELTTKEAADILNVSRPFLVKLLDRRDIPYHRVGTHRRLNVEDVLAYRDLRAARRREKLRELTELSEQLKGGYRSPAYGGGSLAPP